MKRLIATISAALCMAGAAFAGDFQTGYFLDDYNYAYRMNPALTPNHGFVGLPFIGNTSLSTNSNFGLNAVLHPYNGKLVTFLHPEISTADALGSFNGGVNKADYNFSTNLLSVGFKGGRFFHTIDFNVRSMGSADIPFELLSFLKESNNNNGSYHIGKISASTSNFLEAAYGISFTVGGNVKVGARIKGLIGLADIEMKLSNVDITMNGDMWQIKSNGSLTGAVDGLEPVTKADGKLDLDKTFSHLGDKFPSPSGYGVVLDLGAQVTIIPDYLVVSGSITDLGGIGWTNKLNANTSGTSWTYTGTSNIPLSEGNTDFGNEVSQAFDDLKQLVDFKDEGEASVFEMLPITFRAGGELRFLPYMSAGLLATVRTGTYGWSELRASLNADYKVISGSVSAAYNSFGVALGAAANLNLRYFNLFVGTDALPFGKTTPEGVPISKINMHVVTGLSIQF